MRDGLECLERRHVATPIPPPGEGMPSPGELSVIKRASELSVIKRANIYVKSRSLLHSLDHLEMELGTTDTTNHTFDCPLKAVNKQHHVHGRLG